MTSPRYVIVDRSDYRRASYVQSVHIDGSFGYDSRLEYAYVFPDLDSADRALSGWKRRFSDSDFDMSRSGHDGTTYRLSKNGVFLVEYQVMSLDAAMIEVIMAT